MFGVRVSPPHTLRAFAQSPCLSDLERAVVLRVLAMADELDVKAVIVGGAVRDWLLGLPVTDIDISVEGDGIEFARALLARHGGKLTIHEKFRTSTWHVDGLDIDVTTARTEVYDYPATLPRVHPSTQMADLSRRDFTINALALHVGDHWMTREALLDPHGGLTDLERGILRAFHPQSFVDDPTRIFRAGRYAARFGFTPDPQTMTWLEQGLPYLRQLSGERVKYDLELIFAEPEPERALALLAGWDAFHAMAIPIPENEKLAQRFARIRAGRPAQVSVAQAGWGALMYHANQLAAQRWLGLIPFDADTRDALAELGPISILSAQLFFADVKPSARHHLLENFSVAGIWLAWLFEQNPHKRDDLARELLEWRQPRGRITGAVLRERGVAPGPIYARVLRRLHDGWLDGEITNDDQERHLLEEVLSAKS